MRGRTISHEGGTAPCADAARGNGFATTLARLKEAGSGSIRLRSAPVRYAAALLVAAALTLPRLFLGHGFEFAPTYALIYPASFLIALWGGFGPGMLCVLLAALSMELLVIKPLYVLKFDMHAVFRFFLPTTCVAIAGLLANALHSIRRRARRQVRAARIAQERFRLIAEACPDVIWRYRVAEPRGFEFVSPSITSISGYTPEEHYADPSLSSRMVYPGDRELFDAFWRDPASFETPFQLRFIRKDGETIWTEQHNICIRDEAGNVVAVQGLARDLTARMQTEDSLRESEARFSTLSTATLEGIALSEGGRILDANQQYADLFGYSVSELIGQDVAQLVAPQDRARVAQLLQSDVGGWGEYLNLKKDGTTFPVEARSRILEHNGRRIRITSIRDISERKAAEEALLRREESFRTATDASGAMVYEIDLLADRINRMHGLERLLGYPEDAAASGREWWSEVTHPEDRGRVFEAVTSAISHGRDFRITYRVRHNAGHYITVENTGRILLDDVGRPLRMIGGVVDITRRKAAEEALAESERRYRQIIESTHEGVWMLDMLGVTTYVNAQMADMLGYTPEDMIGRPGYDFLFEEDVPTAREIIDRCRAGQLACSEMRFRRSDDGEVWFLLNPSLITGRDGQSVGILGMFADVTDRRRAIDELKSASAAKDQFLAVLSHELRNPLQPALMTAASLERDEALPTDLRSDLGLIRRNLELEVRLIDDLLDLNRIAFKKLQLTKRVVDVHAKLLNSLDICRSDAEAKRIDFLTDIGALHAHAYADGGRLQQVFWNVIKNAIKFTPPGGRIELRTSNLNEDCLRITITDTGMGIDPKVLPRLFSEFEQGAQSVTQQYGGLGLGLAISRHLVKMHEGRIFAYSPGVGQGATITIELPTVPEETPLPPLEAAVVDDAARKLRILLVEDHATSAQVTAKLLRRVGHLVEVAADLASGLELGLGSEFDLLISDLGLPDGSGLDLMRRLRERRPGQSGIALSGYGMASDVDKCRDAGFAEHLTKPVDMPALHAAIHRATAPRV
jgi:PAS domain S-box-containing protein